MNSPPDNWPNYLSLPQADIYAFGVIALETSLLENIFRAILSSVARWNKHHTAAVFNRLNNRERQDVILELLPKTTIPAETKALIEHFVAGYMKCIDNRNFLMHSSAGGTYRDASNGTMGLVLERYSKQGNKLVCYPTNPQLRAVADEIHAYATFGSLVHMDVTNYATHVESGHPENYHPVQKTLQKIPPEPVPLSWQIPPDQEEREPPHPALQMISHYRNRKPPETTN